MPVLLRHKKTAEHYAQWLEDNFEKSLKTRIKMFDLIADADYLETTQNKVSKEKIKPASRTKVKKY